MGFVSRFVSFDRRQFSDRRLPIAPPRSKIEGARENSGEERTGSPEYYTTSVARISFPKEGKRGARVSRW